MHAWERNRIMAIGGAATSYSNRSRSRPRQRRGGRRQAMHAYATARLMWVRVLVLVAMAMLSEELIDQREWERKQRRRSSWARSPSMHGSMAAAPRGFHPPSLSLSSLNNWTKSISLSCLPASTLVKVLALSHASLGPAPCLLLPYLLPAFFLSSVLSPLFRLLFFHSFMKKMGILPTWTSRPAPSMKKMEYIILHLSIHFS